MLRAYFDEEVYSCILNVKTVNTISWIIFAMQVFFRKRNYVQSSQRTKLWRNTDHIVDQVHKHMLNINPLFRIFTYWLTKPSNSKATKLTSSSYRLKSSDIWAGGHVISRSTSVGAGGGGRLWLWVSVRGNTVGRILIKQLAHVSPASFDAFSPSHPVKKAMTHRPSVHMSLSEPVPASPATPGCIRSSGRERFVSPQRNLEV